jgi:hypothetical protein
MLDFHRDVLRTGNDNRGQDSYKREQTSSSVGRSGNCMTDAVARMAEKVSLDLKRITAEVAVRHGMLVRQDDPAMLLVTMNELVLQQVMGNIEGRAEQMVAGIETGFLSAQHEALGNVEKAARKAGMSVREEIQKDVAVGRLHARELIVELNSA